MNTWRCQGCDALRIASCGSNDCAPASHVIVRRSVPGEFHPFGAMPCVCDVCGWPCWLEGGGVPELAHICALCAFTGRIRGH